MVILFYNYQKNRFHQNNDKIFTLHQIIVYYLFIQDNSRLNKVKKGNL